MLLDEPLAALDKKLRSKTQLELTTLQKKLKITLVFVTHDQEEAMSLSDRMAIMKNGLILECSSPEEIYEDPKRPKNSDFEIFKLIFSKTLFSPKDLEIFLITRKLLSILNQH